jgi:galactose mutarotase-like enzyme
MRCELPHGIDAVRTVALTSAPTGVRIMTHLTTRRDSDVHFLYAEHPAFPLTPDMEVSLSVPVETHPAPARPSPDFSTTLGGRHDELDLTPIDLGAARDRFSECVSVIRVRHPVAAVTWPSRGVGIRLSWDGTLCPYALLWAQNGVERYPFAGGPGCVAIEPSTVSGLGGLAAAIEGGTSSVLSPKQTLTAQIDFTVHETAPPQSG